MKGALPAKEAKIRDAIRTEKKLCQEAAKARGLSNEYKPWSDLLAYLKGEKKGAKANAARDIRKRLKDEIAPLYVAIGNDDASDDADLLEVSAMLAACLKVLKVDIAPLNEKIAK